MNRINITLTIYKSYRTV